MAFAGTHAARLPLVPFVTMDAGSCAVLREYPADAVERRSFGHVRPPEGVAWLAPGIAPVFPVFSQG